MRQRYRNKPALYRLVYLSTSRGTLLVGSNNEDRDKGDWHSSGITAATVTTAEPL